MADGMQQFACIQSLPSSKLYDPLPSITKKVVSKILDPIIKSTCTHPLVSEGFPAKSFRTMLVGDKSPGPMPSFLNVVYGITLTAAPPSTNILVNGFPLTNPLKYSGFMCRFLAGLSKMAIV